MSKPNLKPASQQAKDASSHTSVGQAEKGAMIWRPSRRQAGRQSSHLYDQGANSRLTALARQEQDYAYRLQAYQGRAMAVVHEGLTLEADPNGGHPASQGGGTSTGNVDTAHWCEPSRGPGKPAGRVTAVQATW